MGLASELLQVERARVAPDLVAQRRRMDRSGPLRTEQEVARVFVQLKPIAGADAECLQYRRR